MAYFTWRIQQKFIHCFLVTFYVLAIYKWLNGQFMYQLQPRFFELQFDPPVWLLMQSGVHKWLLNNQRGWILFDLVFYCMPFIWWLIWRNTIRQQPAAALSSTGSGRFATFTALVWLFVNWIYIQCYILYSSNSIEGHVGWLLMPLLFAAGNVKMFYFMMHALRYYFLFFFVTAALWKFRQGGIFNLEQMSGILLLQHKEFLFNAPGNWYTHLIYWIVQHSFAGWLLYAMAVLLELSFAAGFFTRAYDRWLFTGFILFLVMDILVMRIPYFELLPLSLPLLFSKYQEPVFPVSKQLSV